MAQPTKLFRFAIVFALTAGGVAATNAQSLNQPKPVERFSGVVQFGVPRDTKFVFCEGEDCPERSIKHLYVPPTPRVQEPAILVPQPLQKPEQLSPAKVPIEKTVVKRRKKTATKYECKPVVKTK